jgi:lamin tail-like protein
MHRIRLPLTVLCAVVLLAVAGAQGASSDVVISQVYAGGGNSGATYTNDYVELLNRGSTTIDLSGWTIQYATAAGTSWQATALSGSVAPGRFYLVQLASAASVGAPLPAPDATGTSNLAASGGKVALVRDATPLACGASPGSCSAASLVADLVGYGSASDYEGTGPAPSLTNTTAALRADGGCTDSDNSAADFASGAPSPRNTAAAAASCGSAAPPPAANASAAAAVDLDVAPVVSIALDHPSLSFGTAAAGEIPAALAEHVTVLSNDGAGYSLAVHRTAFTPADLSLAMTALAPTGTSIGPALAGGATAPVPLATAADLVVGTSPARSAAAGDVWSTNIGFTSPLPVLAAGHYSATVTFTVIGR